MLLSATVLGLLIAAGIIAIEKQKRSKKSLVPIKVKSYQKRR